MYVGSMYKFSELRRQHKKEKKCLYRTPRDNNDNRIRVFRGGGSKFDSRKRPDEKKKPPVFKNEGRSQVSCSADDYNDIVNNVFRRVSMPSDDLAELKPQYILCAGNAPGIRRVLGRSQSIMNDLGRSSGDPRRRQRKTRGTRRVWSVYNFVSVYTITVTAVITQRKTRCTCGGVAVLDRILEPNPRS